MIAIHMTESAAPVVLVDLPYAERQLIVVVSDAVVAAEREAKRGDSGTSLEEIAVAASMMSQVAGRVAVLAVETARAAGRARRDGVDVLTVSSTEAASLTFPLGHPRPKVLYVGHPAVPTTYYAAAGFHHHTFEHKFVEAVGLVMALGATQLEVDMKGSEARVDTKRSRSRGSSALFTATLKGNANPTLPAGLVWFPHEPTWQQVAEGRLEYGLTQFQLSVRYEDDYGIDAGLKVKAGKAGLDLGGSFQEHESTVWRIEGKFAE